MTNILSIYTAFYYRKNTKVYQFQSMLDHFGCFLTFVSVGHKFITATESHCYLFFQERVIAAISYFQKRVIAAISYFQERVIAAISYFQERVIAAISYFQERVIAAISYFQERVIAAISYFLALVVWGIRIQPTFALVRVVKGD